MTTTPPTMKTDEQYLQAIRDCLAAGERDRLRGGVHPEHVAPRLDTAPTTASKRMRDLEREGRFVSVDGVPTDSLKAARKSYLPPDHEDAPDGERGVVA